MARSGDHGARTQRDTMFVIATLNPGTVGTTRDDWAVVADRSHELAQLVLHRLDDLLQEPGWTGDSADTFRARITTDLVNQVMMFSESARDMVRALEPVQQAADAAFATASAHDVPWDRNAPWSVQQKKLDWRQYLVNTVVDVATGKLGVDEAASVSRFNSAQAAAPYEVKTASGGVVTTVPATTWSGVQSQAKPQTEVTAGVVAPATNRFDVWMEALSLNAGEKAAVTAAADRTEDSLASYLSDQVTVQVQDFTPITTDPSTTGGLGVFGSPTSSGPMGIGLDGARPGLGTSSVTSKVGDFWATDPGLITPTITSPSYGDGPAWVYPGSTWLDGAGSGAVDPGVFGGSSTSAAGAALAPLGALGAVAAGGVGAAYAGGQGSPSMGAPGFGGMGMGGPGGAGALAPGAGSAAAGGPPTFQVGQGGKPVVGVGTPGTVAANQPVSSLAQARAQGFSGAPVSGAGGAPMGGPAAGGPMAGGRGRKRDEHGDSSDGTWLKEMDDVWGTNPDQSDQDWPR